MKRVILFLVGVIAAITSYAQEIKELWKITENVYTQSEAKSCVAVKGQLVFANKSTGMVEFWNSNGKMEKSYNVNKFLSDNNYGITDETGTFIAYTLGMAITKDNANNIIVNLQFPTADSSRLFVIIPANSNGDDFKFVELTLPSVMQNARMDYMGRAIGDVLNNGFLFISTSGSTYISTINLVDGKQAYSSTCGLDHTTQADVITTSIDEVTNFTKTPTVYYRHRSNRLMMRSVAGNDFITLTNDKGEDIGFDYDATCIGFDVFRIGNEIYYIVPAVDTSGARSDSFAVKKMSTGKTVTSFNIDGCGNYMNSFSVEVNEK